MAREHAKESCQIVDGRHLPPVFALLPNSHSGEGALQVLLLALPSRSKGRRAAGPQGRVERTDGQTNDSLSVLSIH